MRNLTKAEAEVRSALLDVESYDVHLDLRPALEEPAFGSTVEVRFRCWQPGVGTFVELDGEPVEVVLNGRALDVAEGGRIRLDDLAADNVLRVVARCATSRSGEGLHRFVDPADGEVYLYAQAFLDDCQRMLACFDQPDLKAVFRLVVDAPASWSVVGNARGTREGDRWTFAPTERISTYLFTVAAGPYASRRQWHGDVELGLWCRQSMAPHLLTDEEAGELFEVTAQAFDLQEQLFGRRYPFGDTYDQLFVPEFNAGAMENPGAVTFTEQLVFRGRATQARRRTRAMVVAHELSHMWFGNLVTMRWWDDLWLNESFAELLGYLTTDRATRFAQTWVDFCTSRKAWGYRADALPTTHPVAGTAQDARSALLDFDGISYAKGASVLRQLMATIGEDAFFAGVRDHFATHAFGNAVFADLLGAFERAAGRDLQDWAQRWLRTPGTSTLAVVDGALVQSVPDEHPVWREHRTGVGLYARQDGRLVRTDRLDVVVADAPVPLPGADAADLVLPNDDDRTFASVRLDDRSSSALRAGLGTLDDPLARAVGWSSLWHALRDGVLPAEPFVDAVLAHVGAEQDPGVVETLLLQARRAAALYASAPEPLLARVADACLDAAHGVEGDLQLARVRAGAAAAVPAQAPRLRALLDGRDLPPGLALDVELRWLLVQRLSAAGVEVDLDAELERDPSAAGRLAAHTARAAQPDAAAKEAAFTGAVDDAGLSSHEAQALAVGLWQPLQDDLVRPYVARYVEAVPRLWAERSPAAAQALTEALFPSTLPEPEVLAAVDGLLAGELPAGARRVVLEQRSDLARAARARQG
ncbi:MAG TPA: aminopeptidase N [Mycobacteriales bacterium]|nr:aminopeptidase N [Mycobacteriales bacterium]